MGAQYGGRQAAGIDSVCLSLHEKCAGQAAKVDRAECGRSGASASAKREIFRAKMRYAEWGCFGGVRSQADSVAGKYGLTRETVRRKRSASGRFGPKKKTVNVKMEPVGCGETQRFRLLGVRVQGGQRGRMQEGQASKCAH